MIATSLWHIDNENSELRTEPIQQNKIEDQLLISTAYSMVSTGTEYLVASGLVDHNFSAKMSVPYMKGNFNLPIKYGYACSGLDLENKLYHFMHPHQDKCFIELKDLFAINNLSPLKVPLISNMETVLNGIWDATLKESDDIAIIGYGNVGSLLAQTLKVYKNKKATIIERNDWRVNAAEKNGFKVSSSFKDSYNVIFNTSCSNEAMNSALKALRMEGKLVEMSWFGNNNVTLSLGREFHYNRLKIISSQVGHIPEHMKPIMDYLKRKKLAASILEDDSFDGLITDVIKFEKAPLFYNDLRNRNVNEGLIYLFEY